MLKKILIVLAVIVLIPVVLGLVMSTDYRVSRKVTIQAEVARVHAMCGELKNWPRWAPWEESDPTIVTTYGEKTTGVGAHQSWTGDSGDGELTFTRCDPASGIAYDMYFIDGDKKIPAVSAMNYQPVDGGIEVEWIMEGQMDMPVVGPYFALAADTMIGPMFEQGLGKLKAACEAE